MAVKVAINGYGTIGKRVADAVSRQPDMEIVGVTKTRPTFQAWSALSAGFRLFAASEEHLEGFHEAGIDPSGTLSDLLDEADIVVDCTPNKVGANYASVYKERGVKAIFQGGERHEVAGISFNAYANYTSAFEADYVRVVSCNTTGLCRSLYPLKAEFGIKSVLAMMIRRSADPWDSKKGPINAIEPALKVPSHHGPDVRTVIPDLDISTIAVRVPTTLMHLHAITVDLEDQISSLDVMELWSKYRRLLIVSGGRGIKSTAQIMELARDMGRKRGDLYEIAIWQDGIHVSGHRLYYFQAVHQESDVVPENVDCIRSMLGLIDDPWKSIDTTDRTLNIGGN